MCSSEEARADGRSADRESRVELRHSEVLSDVVPYAYSATTRGLTRPVYLAGVCPLDASGVIVHSGDIELQAQQCLNNMQIALYEAGAHLRDVVYTRVLVATASQPDLVRAWDVIHSAFRSHEVPSTLSGVPVLGWPGQLVELEVVAAVPTEHQHGG